MPKETAIDLFNGGAFSIREIVTANQEYQEFFDSILEQNALTPEQQLALGEAVQKSVEKRDNMGAFLARLAGEAEVLKKEEARLAARRRKFERIGEILTEGLHLQLVELGVKRVEGQKFSFAIKKNPPSVEITDETQIPAEFIDYVPSIKKAPIKDALAEGKDVPGARLVTEKTRLEIK
jgi:Siphovirus Gp157